MECGHRVEGFNGVEADLLDKIFFRVDLDVVGELEHLHEESRQLDFEVASDVLRVAHSLRYYRITAGPIMKASPSGWNVRWRCRCPRLDERGVEEMSARREELLERCLRRGARLYEKNFAKLHTGGLSPGCLACARGEWSYLEVSQLCQKSCFYCPRSQTRRGRPYERMLGLTFDSSSEYAAAVRRLGFRGVGLSGGEPLLAMDRTVGFLRSLREEGGEGLYLWAYTNGQLADEARLGRLREAGIDELRFDLSACGYDLSALRRARNVIPTVTVEIPAIPEDLEVVKALLERLVEEGVSYLNLHQLTCTPFNCGNFCRRGYTVVDNGPMSSPSVVESELAALELIDFALERGLKLPINYCSFIYKSRFHARIRRARLAGHWTPRASLETVTEAGWLRAFMVKGTRGSLAGLARRLPSGGSRLGGSGLVVAPETLGASALRGQEVVAVYSEYEQALPGVDGGRGRTLGFETGRPIMYLKARRAEVVLRGGSERARCARGLFGERFAGLEFIERGRHPYRAEGGER